MHSTRRSASPSERRPWRAWLALGALLLLAASATAANIAVVVHPDVATDGITFAELRKIMRGDQQYWEAGKPITVLVRAPTAEERTILLTKIYEMSEAQFKQFWIAKVFRAETTSGPKIVLSNEMAVDLVKVIPGAIALVGTKPPEGVKVLKIDGHLPGEKGYPLR